MIISILTLMLNLIALNPQSQVIDTHEESAPKRKLIVFSGSDWCKNCIRFKEEVLSSEVFKDFAKDHIEIITADFPQRTKLPKETIARNEALAEKFNPQGEFPRLVLLSPNGEEGKVIPFTSSLNANAFVEELRDSLQED